MSGQKIIEGLRDAVAGNLYRVTIEGQTWVREDLDDSEATANSPLRCPFCGGGRIHDYYIRDGRAVGCRDCGGSIHAYNPDATTKAYEKWNCRRKDS